MTYAKHQFGLALGAMYSGSVYSLKYNDSETWPYETFITMEPAGFLFKWLTRYGLYKDWGAFGAAAIKEKIEWLLSEGHRTAYDPAVRFILTNHLLNASEEELRRRATADMPAMKLYVAQDAAKAAGAAGIAAWDIARGANMVNSAFEAGYLSEAEAQGYLNRFADLARSLFKDWPSYAHSYLAGLAGFSAYDENQAEEYSEKIAVLMKHQAGPWRNMPFGA